MLGFRQRILPTAHPFLSLPSVVGSSAGFKNEQGFTFVELSSVLAINAILVITFATILFMSQKQSRTIQHRIDSQRDMLILDKLVHHHLLKSFSDSLFIYVDESSEQAQTPSNSGAILVTIDADSNSYRITSDNNQLVWEKNAMTLHPVTASIAGLNFSKSPATGYKYIEIAMNLYQETDTVRYVKSFIPRN